MKESKIYHFNSLEERDKYTENNTIEENSLCECMYSGFFKYKKEKGWMDGSYVDEETKSEILLNSFTNNINEKINKKEIELKDNCIVIDNPSNYMHVNTKGNVSIVLIKENININKIILDVFAEEDTYIDCGFGINIPKGTTKELTILKLYGNWQIRVLEKNIKG